MGVIQEKVYFLFSSLFKILSVSICNTFSKAKQTSCGNRGCRASFWLSLVFLWHFPIPPHLTFSVVSSSLLMLSWSISSYTSPPQVSYSSLVILLSLREEGHWGKTYPGHTPNLLPCLYHHLQIREKLLRVWMKALASPIERNAPHGNSVCELSWKHWKRNSHPTG